MKALFMLVRIGLRTNFSLATVRHRLLVQKKDRWLALLVLVGIVGLAPLLTGYLKLIRFMYAVLQPLGQENILVTLALLQGQMLVLLFGILYIISAFYFARDLEILIPLPLRPITVIQGKFFVVLVNTYLTMLPLTAPLLIYLGFLDRKPASYWLLLPLVYLLLPIIPLAIISLLVIGMMRLIRFSRKKDALMVMGSVIIILAVLAVQFSLGRMEAGGESAARAAVLHLLSEKNGLVPWLGANFPPSIWATRALVEPLFPAGLTQLGIFLSLSLLCYIGLVKLGERLFYQGLIGLREMSAVRNSNLPLALARRLPKRPRPMLALFLREWRLMNRTPIFFLNGVFIIFLAPLLFFITMNRSGRPIIAMVRNLLVSGHSLHVILGAAGFLTISSALNGTASSTLSREGAQFWLSRIIPVSWRRQTVAKFLHCYSLSVLGVAVSTIVLVFSVKLPAGVVLLSMLLSLMAGAVLNVIGMAIDLARPKLDWINPQRAIKQNLNVFVALLLGSALVTVCGYLAIKLFQAGLSSGLIYVLLLAALAVALIFGFRGLLSWADRRYPAIER
jgi:ABC-2 type transport system permease protein